MALRLHINENKAFPPARHYIDISVLLKCPSQEDIVVKKKISKFKKKIIIITFLFSERAAGLCVLCPLWGSIRMYFTKSGSYLLQYAFLLF